MKLIIKTPFGCTAERRYIAQTIFGSWLGVRYELVQESRPDIVITAGDAGELHLADSFFQQAGSHWLKAGSLPVPPLPACRLPEPFQGALTEPLPILFGQSVEGHWLRADKDRLECGIDLLGGVFFLLTRYEELVAPVADSRDRYPASASLASREGFLMRALGDEYVELLWTLLQNLWPQLRRKPQRYQVFLSHDVDHPFAIAGRKPGHLLRSLGGDVIRRRSLTQAARRVASACRVVCGDLAADPCNTFAYIMSQSEQRGWRSAFYFITRRRNKEIDGSHEFNTPLLRGVMEAVANRDHEIGLHPGYETFDTPQRVIEDNAALSSACASLGITQPSRGGRQHYLRWRNPITWQAWEQAGLDYDSTLGFADHIGFRCGTCREYPAYDLIMRKPLRLLERPLLVMERSLLDYMNLPWEEAYERVVRVIESCRRIRGNFTMLWHNNLLIDPVQRKWYEAILDAAA